MSEQTKVDVLAVMDELAATYGPRALPFPKLSRVTEARAAVAELVEVAREIPPYLRDREPIKARLIAALARVGGSP